MMQDMNVLPHWRDGRRFRDDGEQTRAQLLDLIRQGYRVFYQFPTIRWLRSQLPASNATLHRHLQRLVDDGQIIAIDSEDCGRVYVLAEAREALKGL